MSKATLAHAITHLPTGYKWITIGDRWKWPASRLRTLGAGLRRVEVQHVGFDDAQVLVIRYTAPTGARGVYRLQSVPEPPRPGENVLALDLTGEIVRGEPTPKKPTKTAEERAQARIARHGYAIEVVSPEPTLEPTLEPTPELAPAPEIVDWKL